MGFFGQGVTLRYYFIFMQKKITVGANGIIFVENAGRGESADPNLSMEARLNICNSSIEMG